MNALPILPPLNIRSDITNIGERWIKWPERLENYLVTMKITDENRKQAILLHLIGENAYETYMSLPEPSPPDPFLTSTHKLAKQRQLASRRLENFIRQSDNFHNYNACII
ncbi:hypothetical protein QE152_g14455 [Popillia japonica]|uniref:Uncharacterized protein n=1 Tax=Popillia japonica TaxID=7064 RepID=A0AAW1L9L1_POPJA